MQLNTYLTHTNLIFKNKPILHFNIKALLRETDEWEKNNTPIYLKIYNTLKDVISKKNIPDKTKLPPTRVLAKDLNISRSTIIKAFDMLSFERYIIAKKGSGNYVNYQNKVDNISLNQEKKYKYPTISKRVKLFKKHSYINTDNFSKENIAFRPGLPPLDIFPIDKWKHISNESWRESTPTSLSYAPSEGIESLRINIMNYLRVYRNIQCDYNQIIITSGSLHSLYLIGNTLINKEDKIIMENPTFPRAYNLFKSLRASIIPCNIDNKGINISNINEKKIKLIYTTPSNQYPLGVKMSLERRQELLQFVSKKNALIIEDDYDHEFSNWTNPIQSLYSLDKESRVIYIGTFNKILHPSLRIGYMIAPKYLVNPMKAIYEQSSRFINVHTQDTLNKFMTKDFLNKHLRNVINTSLIRKKIFTENTQKVFEIKKEYNGLHIIAKIKNKLNDTLVYKKLLEKNVVAYPLSNYYITKEKKEGLVMGYSSVNNKVMKEKIELIHSAILK